MLHDVRKVNVYYGVAETLAFLCMWADFWKVAFAWYAFMRIGFLLRK